MRVKNIETRTGLEEFTQQDTGASLLDIASSDNSVISSREVMTLKVWRFIGVVIGSLNLHLRRDSRLIFVVFSLASFSRSQRYPQLPPLLY